MNDLNLENEKNPATENLPENDDIRNPKWYDVLINLFFSPGEAFQQIDNKTFTWLPISLLIALQWIATGLMIPKMMELVPALAEQVMAQRNIQNITLEQLTKLLERQVLISAFINPVIMIFIMLLLISVYFLIVFKFTDYDTTFKKIFAVISWSYVVNGIHSLLVGILLMASGYKGINSFQDFQGKGLGLHLLLNWENLETTFQKMFYIFLLINNPFFIWSMILMVIGIKTIYKAPTSKAVLFTVIFWVIFMALMGWFISMGLKAQ